MTSRSTQPRATRTRATGTRAATTARGDLAPFRRSDCPTEADRLLEQGLVRPVVADVLVAFDTPDNREVRTAAVALLAPPDGGTDLSWVVGFESAAWLHTGSAERLPAAGRPVTVELQVIVPPGRRRPSSVGIRGRQLTLSPEQVMFFGPVAVTVPARTAADVARDLPPGRALEVLRRLELTGVRPHHVLQMLSTMRYARGVAVARQVVSTWAEGG